LHPLPKMVAAQVNDADDRPEPRKVVQEKNDRWNSLYYQVARGNVFCLVHSTWTPDKKDRECEGDVP